MGRYHRRVHRHRGIVGGTILDRYGIGYPPTEGVASEAKIAGIRVGEDLVGLGRKLVGAEFSATLVVLAR